MTHSKISRRNVITGAAATLAAGTMPAEAIAGEHCDAELFHLEGEFRAAFEAWNKLLRDAADLFDGAPAEPLGLMADAINRQCERAESRVTGLIERILTAPARTGAGARVKIRCTRAFTSDCDMGEWTEAMVASIDADLAGVDRLPENATHVSDLSAVGTAAAADHPSSPAMAKLIAAHREAVAAFVVEIRRLEAAERALDLGTAEGRAEHARIEAEHDCASEAEIDASRAIILHRCRNAEERHQRAAYVLYGPSDGPGAVVLDKLLNDGDAELMAALMEA